MAKEFRKDLMHKTRRELVDFVFRGEDPNRAFGYEKSNPHIKRDIGEVWEDDVYRYEQKEGFVLKTGKNHDAFQSAREFLREQESRLITYYNTNKSKLAGFRNRERFIEWYLHELYIHEKKCH